MSLAHTDWRITWVKKKKAVVLQVEAVLKAQKTEGEREEEKSITEL